MMMMKRIFLVLALCLFGGAPAFAAEDCFVWTFVQEDGATDYRIYRDPSTDVQFVFPDFAKTDVCPDPDDATRCKACVQKLEDGKNHRFAATAYNKSTDQESDFSATADVFFDGEKRTIPQIEQGPTVPEVLQYVIEATIKKVAQ